MTTSAAPHGGPETGFSPVGTRIAAHRGAWSQRRERNTKAAFQGAIDAGIDLVEFDVRRTADGQLVVFHDARLGRRRLSQLTLSELRERSPVEIPTLAEVVELAAGRIGIDVEIKERGYVRQLVNVVAGALSGGGCVPTADVGDDRAGVRDEVVFTSYRPDVLADVRRYWPAELGQVRTGLVLIHHLNLAAKMARARVDFLVPNYRIGTRPIVTASGLPLWLWTVDGRAAITRALHDPRVEVVITNHPETARAAQTAVSTGSARHHRPRRPRPTRLRLVRPK